MADQPPDFAAMRRAIGFVLIALAIVAVAVHRRYDEEPARAPLPVPSIPSDALARELARCQAIGMAVEEDAACKAAWAENRRRFFASPPTEPASSTPTSEQKPADNPEDR
ncbi:MAG: putative entry exclusion protein TrbK-alt [Roseiarcus sp.]